MSLLSIISGAYDALQAESSLLSLNIGGADGAVGRISAMNQSPLSNPDPWVAASFGAFPGYTGKVVNPHTSMRVAAVYACVTALSQSVGQLPCVLYKISSDGGKKPAIDHPLYNLLLNMPNAEMTAQDGHELDMNNLLLRGVTYRQIVRSGGEVVEINPLHPDYMFMYRDTVTGKLSYEYHDPFGSPRSLRSDEVWRTIGMSFNGLNGVSPIAYARESIGLAMATEEHGAKLFSNGAQIATAFEHPGVMSKVAQDNFLLSVQQKYSGSSNAFKSIVLEEGMKVSKVGMTSVDSQFIEARKFQLEEICRIFRVPPHKIQELSRATFNNIEHLTMDFKNSSLMPWIQRFEQTIFRDLLLPNERKRYVCEFDTTQLDRGDTAALVNLMASGIANTWLSPNEARGMFHLNPREGGDKFENPNTSSGKEKPGAPVSDPSRG